MLIEIFKHLELDDLFTVAKCSKDFESLAQKAFTEGKLQSRLFRPLEFGPHSDVEEDIVRVFGEFATEFEEYRMPSHFWNYLNIKKLKVLHIEVSMSTLPEFMMRMTANDTRFEDLEELRLHGWRGRGFEVDFRECFPKLKSLVVHHSRHPYTLPNQYLLPVTLEKLDYVGDSNSLRSIFRLNPEIVELRVYCTLSDFEYMVDCGLRETLKILDLQLDEPIDNIDQSHRFSATLARFKRLKELRGSFSGGILWKPMEMFGRTLWLPSQEPDA